jgi:hypothetical protein
VAREADQVRRETGRERAERCGHAGRHVHDAEQAIRLDATEDAHRLNADARPGELPRPELIDARAPHVPPGALRA